MTMLRMVLASRLEAALRAFEELRVDRTAGGARLVYIPTADLGDWLHVKAWRPMAVRQLKRAGFRVRVLDVAKAGIAEIRAVVHAADVVAVGGGNTFYLLRELRRSGAAQVLVDEIQQGKPYIGISAGAVVAGPDIGYIRRMDDPSRGLGLIGTRGLGLVDFRVVPHLGSWYLGRAAAAIFRKSSERMPLKTLTDRQAVIVRGDNVVDFNM